jgi:hypothetical protein
MSEDRRQDGRESVSTAGTIYDKQGAFLLPCMVRDFSRTGARIELFKDATLPQYFLLSLMPDGSARRLCSRIWQLSGVAGIRFLEDQPLPG